MVIRSTPVRLTFAAISEQTTVDINFTMTDVGHTSGTSHSGGLRVDGGGGAVTPRPTARLVGLGHDRPDRREVAVHLEQPDHG